MINRDQLRLEDMVAYCKTKACLRGKLLDYFGQAHPAACGHCGNCRGEFVTEDITRQAQIVLSCIQRIHRKLGYHVGGELAHQGPSRQPGPAGALPGAGQPVHLWPAEGGIGGSDPPVPGGLGGGGVPPHRDGALFSLRPSLRFRRRQQQPSFLLRSEYHNPSRNAFIRLLLVRYSLAENTPFAFSARDSHESRKTCTGTDEDSLVALFIHQLVDCYRLTDNYVCLNINAELLHVLDLWLHNALFRETELWNTVG